MSDPGAALGAPEGDFMSAPMTKQLTYSEKLKDPRWQKKRLEIMQRDGFKCRHCSCETTTLNVHHKLYSKGKMPWDYDEALLITLCEDCHELAEKRRAQVLEELGDNPAQDFCIVLATRLIGSWSGKFPDWAYALDMILQMTEHERQIVLWRDGQADEPKRPIERADQSASLAFSAICAVAEGVQKMREFAHHSEMEKEGA